MLALVKRRPNNRSTSTTDGSLLLGDATTRMNRDSEDAIAERTDPLGLGSIEKT